LSADWLSADVDIDYRTSKAPQSLFNGHLTRRIRTVRAGDNARRHGRRWTGFADWWSELFGSVKFVDRAEEAGGPFGTAPARRNYRDAQAFLAPDVLPCVADSLEMNPNASPDRLRQASLQLLEKTANRWGRSRSLSEAMNPVFPWAPSVRVLGHAFERDFTIVEARTEIGAQYECGATAPNELQPSGGAQQYGTYYGALLQVVTDGRQGGAVVFVWRRVGGEWRLVAYRAID
jgi:hypothetical protein